MIDSNGPARTSQLDEQGAVTRRIGDYVQRWARWVLVRVGGIAVELGSAASN
jgi:hypothetical protein